jgi:hypothetical protein
MKYILGILFVLAFTVISAQTDTAEFKAVTNYNQVKIGSSIQANINLYGYDYEYYDGYGGYYYYYNDEYIYKTGPNTHLFLAYEHLWQFNHSSIAVGIEPQIGFSFYEYITTGYTGVNLKFYWLSKPNFRMGMATYFGNTYANKERKVAVPMDGGAYYQNKEVTTHYNQFSLDISLIPFQFRVKGAPITIESQFALFGFNATRIKSERYDNGYDDDYYRDKIRGSIYALKFELKIGYEF